MPVRNVNLTMPNPYTTDLAAIERRRRIAELMQQQGMTPLPSRRTAGGWEVPISPMEGLGKMAQAFSGAYQQSKADEEAKKLSEKYMEDYRRTMAQGLREWQGTPATEGQESLAFEGGRGAPQPGTPPNPQAAMATFGEHPLTQSFGQALAAQMMKQPQPVSIGSGGLRMPSGEIIPPAARPQGPQAIGSGGLRLPSGEIIPPVMRPQLQTNLTRLIAERDALPESDPRRKLYDTAITHVTNPQSQNIRVYNPPAVTVTEIQDPNNPNATIKVDARTGRVIGKGAGGSMKPLTESQARNSLFGSRAAQSHKILSNLEENISTTGLAVKESLSRAPFGLGGPLGVAGNVLLSADQQKVEQAQRDFVNAVLRQESGAVISDQEFDNAKKQYFPQPGDSEAVIKQKRANRTLAIQGFARAAGPAGADVQTILNSPLMPAQGQQEQWSVRLLPGEGLR